jgi:DNA-binding NarL/FixJ family response regulator
MYDSAPLVERVFQTGAKGFVSKNAQPEDLIHAVHEVFAGRSFNSETQTHQQANFQQQEESQRLASLTPKEYELLRLLTQGHSVNECAQLMNMSPKTVSNHQTQIKEKLGTQTLAAMVHLAQRHGVIGGSGF